MSNDSLRSREKPILFQMVKHNWIDNNHIANIGIDAFAVYTVIRRHAGPEGTNAFPSYTTIQERTGITRKRIAAAIQRLVELNYIEMEKEKRKTGERNVYTVLDSSEAKKGEKISKRKPPQRKKEEEVEEGELADIAKRKIANHLSEASAEESEVAKAITEMDRKYRARDYYWCCDVLGSLKDIGVDAIRDSLKTYDVTTLLDNIYLGRYWKLSEAV